MITILCSHLQLLPLLMFLFLAMQWFVPLVSTGVGLLVCSVGLLLLGAHFEFEDVHYVGSDKYLPR